jgi:hypothetical protein
MGSNFIIMGCILFFALFSASIWGKHLHYGSDFGPEMPQVTMAWPPTGRPYRGLPGWEADMGCCTLCAYIHRRCRRVSNICTYAVTALSGARSMGHDPKPSTVLYVVKSSSLLWYVEEWVQWELGLEYKRSFSREVQLVRARADMSYIYVEGIPGKVMRAPCP